MIFILVFSALAVSMASLSGVNLQIADNQRKANSALSAAQSGLEVGKYLVNGYSKTSTIKTAGDVTQAKRDETWAAFRAYISNPSNTVAGKPWTDPVGLGRDLVSSYINFGSNGEKFQVKYYYDSNNITLESTGIIPTSDGSITKKATVGTNIERNGDVLNYAIASRGRMWLTGDSTVHGNIYSSWKYQNISPFNITSDSTVEGTISTILSNIKPATGEKGPDLYAGTTKMPYDLETLDVNGKPVYDEQGNKVISPTDEIQGQCEGINYGVNAVNMPGMKISDYDTSQYKSQATTTPTYNSKTATEYFPHAAGNYSQPSGSGSLKLTRYVCTGKTLTNTKVAASKNALFKNCTFDGILYIDCGATGGTYNNVRFENCVFNGPIITNTPNYSDSTNWWMKNCLYFTGEETFQNETDIPATILAPNFNVNLGNTNPNSGENNVLTGAIVGGIVDIRGNAEIYGTVISMYDTSGYSSGYVSNIGATLGDGGSETTVPGDVGVINITPDPDKLLPSGITTPIVIKPSQNTYSEEI
jgi:hypothetical protein